MATAYQQKLLDPRWQRKRLAILNRANFRCEKCGDASSTLHVHHGYYKRGLDPWEYEDETLHCLCVSCHEKAQDRLSEIHREIAILGPKFDAESRDAIHQLWRSCIWFDRPEERQGMSAWELFIFLLYQDGLVEPGDREMIFERLKKVTIDFREHCDQLATKDAYR